MDLGELPVGPESPFVPALMWVALAVLMTVAVVLTVHSARLRPSRHRRAVVIIGAGLLLLGVGAGVSIAARADLAARLDQGACPWIPDGVYFVATYETFDGQVLSSAPEPRDGWGCLLLQQRLVTGVLAGYALAVAVGGVGQIALSRRP